MQFLTPSEYRFLGDFMEDEKEYRDFLEGFRALKIKSVDDDFIDAEGMEPVPPDLQAPIRWNGEICDMD